MSELDEFLAHHGVKGMKWGQTKSRTTSAPKRLPSKETVKKVGVELAFGSVGAAAVLAGLGPPVSMAIGLSSAVLRQPAVHKPIGKVTVASAKLMKEIGSTKMSAVRQAQQTKHRAKKLADGVIYNADNIAMLM